MLRAHPEATVADDDDLEFVDRPKIRLRRFRSSRSQQMPALVSRVCALGASGTPLVAIDQCLHEKGAAARPRGCAAARPRRRAGPRASTASGYVNSKGALWPRRSDGCVLRRILASHNIAVPAPAPAAAQRRVPAHSSRKHGSAGSSKDGMQDAAAAEKSVEPISGLKAQRKGAAPSHKRQSRRAVDGCDCDDFVGAEGAPVAEAASCKVGNEASARAPPRAVDVSAVMTPMPECGGADVPVCQPPRSATDKSTSMPTDGPQPTARPDASPTEAASCASGRPQDRLLVVAGSQSRMPESGPVPSDCAACGERGTEEDSTSSQQDSPISRALRARQMQSEESAPADQHAVVSFDAFRASDDGPRSLCARAIVLGLAPARLPIAVAGPARQSGGRRDASRHADNMPRHAMPPRPVSESPVLPSAGRSANTLHGTADSPTDILQHAESRLWTDMAAVPGAHSLRTANREEIPAASQSADLHPGIAIAAALAATRSTSVPRVAPPTSPIASSPSSFESRARVAPRVHGRHHSRTAGRTAAAGAQDSDATPAGRRKRTAKRKDRPPTSLASQVAQDGSRCQVCSLPWHRSGSHQACTLPCGHLFGRSCIEAELRRRAASTRERCECPICKSAAFVRQVRPVFVTSEAAADEAQLSRRRAELEAELANEGELARNAAQRREAAEARIADLRSTWAALLAARQPLVARTACDANAAPTALCISHGAEAMPEAQVVCEQ
jgi:E3 ubiquitin-protein ligase RFWD3